MVPACRMNWRPAGTSWVTSSSLPTPGAGSGMCRRGAGAGRRSPTAMATVMPKTGAVSESRPAPTLKADVHVMLEATRDELPAIWRLWPRFRRPGRTARGRQMYARAVREDDDRPAPGSIPGSCRVAGICGPGSPETRPGHMRASARPCGHSWHWRLPLIPTALSWSTTGATRRLNCGYPSRQSPGPRQP